MKDERKPTCFVNDDGQYVAWPLHSPAVPGYGDWAFVEIEYYGEGSTTRVTYIRSLTVDEINKIRRGHMVWGAKLSGAPWALVEGRLCNFGAKSFYDIAVSTNNKQSIGV